jgi:putative phosphoesterase
MKILVIGDSHGNIANLKHVLGFGKHIKCKAVIHTGDWNNIKSLETVFNYNIPIYAVLGNADIDPKLIKKLKIRSEKFSEDFLKFKLDGINFGAVHRFTKDQQLMAIDCSFVFTGHYHSQKEWEADGIKIIRPGALENKIEFAVFDTVTKIVEFINHDKI